MATHVGNILQLILRTSVGGTAPNPGSYGIAVNELSTPATGTTDGQWDLGGGKTYSVTSTPTAVDLRSFTPEGAPSAQTIVDCDVLLVMASASNTQNCTVSVGASNGFAVPFGASGSCTLAPGGWVLWRCPTSAGATDATHKTLDLAAASGTQSMGVYLLGRSA